MAKLLMEGNQALAEAAIHAGCRYFFGYPITPQSEIPEYLSRRLPQVGGVYLQAESEVSAINMVFGAAGTGARVFTASSSPGISLMSEGISYIAACELPCVLVNVQRGGPGLGNIAPSQADYNQATKGIGHGDFHLLVLAPDSVQEMADLTILAFDLADKYRNPVMILSDGILGQMMEPVEFSEEIPEPPVKPWAVTGASGRKRNIINSLHIAPEVLEARNLKLQTKYAEAKENECRCENYLTEDAELVVAAFGSCARIAKAAVEEARSQGIKAGLCRPITVWPFPEAAVAEACENARACIVTEMNEGQMVYDIRLALKDRIPVHSFGKMGGVIPTPKQILDEIKKLEVKPGV
ncbi:MAG: 3-methyl-2-oxobutanoate dehydrogenase subunit VorB [Bacillota bacterium]|jgi:2-oxoglutarate ferredoxin oxidoreductase subunit alpha